MARQARVVVPGAPHHVTQRGNRRQPTFFGDRDYLAYLHIARECFQEAGVEVWSYCLMPNHVHLIAAPSTEQALARAVGATHVRYTRQINLRERWTGYLWQGRFASFPMDEDYLITCARYLGLNPVRAKLTARAIDWPWSSVRAHVEGRHDPLLTPGPLAQRLGERMARFYDVDLEQEALRKLRRASGGGVPWAPPPGSRRWRPPPDGRWRSLCAGGRPRRLRPGKSTCPPFRRHWRFANGGGGCRRRWGGDWRIGRCGGREGLVW